MRHLLNIRVRTRKAAGRRAYLPEIRVQSPRHRIDHLDHVFTVTRERLLHGAIFKQRSDNRVFRREWLEFPVARRFRNRNTEAVECFRQLLLRIEVDVLALWSTKERALRRFFGQHFLQLFRKLVSSFFDNAQLFEPALLVHVKARQLDVDGAKIPYSDQLAWAGIATLTGLPATVAPIGRTESGLPIGVQIIGGFLQDRTTIAFAGLIEREFGGFTPPPL